MDKRWSGPKWSSKALVKAVAELRSMFVRLWTRLKLHGTREPLGRYLSHAAVVAVVAFGVWAASKGLDKLPADDSTPLLLRASASEPTPQAEQGAVDLKLPPFAAVSLQAGGVSRLVDVHTLIPTRPRIDILKYVVQTGDTLFGIAEKFGLKPESILWGNWATLEGDPHTLTPGQELDITPVNGVIHQWSAGEGLNGVASFYGVTAQDIIDWPGNHLDPAINVENPPIEAGALLVVPGGKRELPTWRAPRIRRDNPAAARVLGPGHCGSVYDGPVGTGAFVWPTGSHYVSGYTFIPNVHPGIDIGGKVGYAVFAADSGVVVYSGWNNWGYGNVLVIDHGNGWQTLYAHLDQIYVGCGQAIFQGQEVAAMGTTGNSSGPHLHFEMMSDEFGKVNPPDFLP